MIDTVDLRITDLIRHETLVKHLDKLVKYEGVSVNLSTEPDTVPLRQKRIFQTLISFHNTNKLIRKAHFNKVKSSHYDVHYYIDYLKDEIKINLSIPKFVYGTNIFLATAHPYGKTFNLHKEANLKKAFYNAYDNLFISLQRIFKMLFGEIPIDWGFVKLARVDLCFNQVFPSKAEALDYLASCKKKQKKYSRETSHYEKTYATSLMYVTRDYSFKIYHKGTEFKDHDKKELSKLNEERNRTFKFDLETYQSVADRTLRYEMTVRGRYMAKLYMNNIFRHDCEIWQSSLELFKQDKSKQKSKNYLTWRRSLEPIELKQIAYCKELVQKVKEFYLSDRYLKDDSLTDHEEFHQFPRRKPKFYRPALFCASTFDLITEKFLNLVDEYALKSYTTKDEILRRLEDYNEKAAQKTKLLKMKKSEMSPAIRAACRKISKTKIILLLSLLEHNTFEEVQKQQMFNRSTWYNHRKDLKLLGITEQHLMNMNVNARFDLYNYFQQIYYNASKIKNLHFFN